MKPKLSDFDCYLSQRASPAPLGSFQMFKQGESQPVGEIIVKDEGRVPEIAYVTVFQKEMRGKGLAQAMYDEVEDRLGLELKASDNLSFDGFRLWQRRNPDQVKNSLYHFKDALVGKHVRSSEASGEIVGVNNTTVSVQAPGSSIKLPVRPAILKELGLLPLSAHELERWGDGNKVSRSDGAPLKVYHGTSEDFDHFDDRPTYFSADPKYGYIQKQPNVHECYISIKRPLYVDKVSDIESLRSVPEKVDALERLGYDGVIYADPKNPIKGVTGWGNDSSQYVVFSREQILKADLYPDIESAPPADSHHIPAADLVHEGGRPKTFFHGTSSFFREFRDSRDIGFHFGTKAAAKERLAGMEPEVSVEFSEPSSTEKLCAQVARSPEPEQLIDKTFHLMIRKFNSPRHDLYDILKDMSNQELEELATELRERSDSEVFLRKAKEGNKRPQWVVTVDGEDVGGFEREATAKAYAQNVKQSFIKRANLVLNNPLRLQDLGMWAAIDIAEEAGFDTETINEIFDNTSLSEQDYYRRVRQELQNQGYDGIVYENAAEDIGSDSYIVFSPSQIVQIDPLESPFEFEEKSRSQRRETSSSFEVC